MYRETQGKRGYVDVRRENWMVYMSCIEGQVVVLVDFFPSGYLSGPPRPSITDLK